MTNSNRGGSSARIGRIAQTAAKIAAMAALAGATLSACSPKTAADETKSQAAQAEAYRAQGNLVRALSVRADIVEQQVKAYGEFSEPNAQALHDLASAFHDLGDLTNAIGSYKRVIQIREKLKSPKDVSLAPTLDELGRAYMDRGDFAKANAALVRSITIRSTALGWNDPSVGVTTLYMGRVFVNMSNWWQAKLFFDTAQKSFEKAEGASGRHMPAVYAGQARVASAYRDRPLSIQLLQQAITTAETTAGPRSDELVEYLTELAEVLMDNEEYEKAIPYLVRAENTLNRSVNPESARGAMYLRATGRLFLEGKNNLPLARRELERSLAMIEKRTATNSPYTASVLEHLVAVYWAQGDLARATSTLEHLVTVSEDTIVNAANAFSRADEVWRLQPLRYRDIEKHYAVSLALLTPSPDATRLALQTVLSRKGRTLDLLANEIRVLRSKATPETQPKIGQFLSATRSRERAEFVGLLDHLQGNDLNRKVQPFRVERDKTADDILQLGPDDYEARAAAMMSAPEKFTIEGLSAGLSAGMALVEFTKFIPFDWRKDASHEARYAAFVLFPSGKIQRADLGEAKPIEDLVTRLRGALTDPRADAKTPARELDQLVMRPVRGMLGDTRRLMIAPDDALSLVPFGALVDERGSYLLENWYFTLLTTGREMFRLGAPRPKDRGRALVIANPNFGALAGGSPADSRGISASSLRQVRFRQLPGTADEGAIVAKALGAELLTGPKATRDLLANAHAPSILHIATHGFFLNSATSGTDTSRGLQITADGSDLPVDLDALYRAGLAFAGANQNTADMSSIMTAKEAMWLDLEGTDLVVLSACETGIGELSTGQGVRGLQQAFVTAGARALVMSLWKVDDAATRDLMKDFYATLSQGKGPSVSLRTAQLQMLGNGDRAHPYYWASFVPYGNPSPLPPEDFVR